MKSRRGSSRLAALLAPIVLVVTILAVTACGGTTAASTTVSQASGSTSATAQPANTKTYTSKTEGYSFLYPKSWEVADQTSVGVTAGGSSVSEIGVADPAGTSAGGEKIDVAIVSVYKLTATIDASVMPDVRTEVEQVLSNIESQTPDIKTLDALSQVSFNNMLGFEVTYSFAKSGAPVTSTMYFLFSGNVEYQISAQAADPNWAKDKPIFDAMIASFRPGPSN